MAYLALWPAPHPQIHGENIDTFLVERASSENGTYVELVRIPATDYYGNWVTHYLDAGGSTTSWYKVWYIDGGIPKGSSWKWPAEPTLEVTPQDILNNMQGLPYHAVDAKLIQNWIKWAVEAFETETNLLLTTQQVNKEIHDHKVFNKILSGVRGARVNLRRRPVQSVGKIYYRIRVNNSVDTEWTGLSAQIEYNGHPDGYNPGVITIVPQLAHTVATVGGFYDNIQRFEVSVLFDYVAGFAQWPRGVKELAMRYAMADIMEVAGQADTAGLSSISLDGFAQSFTASATTTTLSAMRIYYKDEIKRLSRRWRKPILR